jgi:hypothetical protein
MTKVTTEEMHFISFGYLIYTLPWCVDASMRMCMTASPVVSEHNNVWMHVTNWFLNRKSFVLYLVGFVLS